MKLHFDRHWYPISHEFNGKKIPPTEVGDVFCKTDWKNDSTFRLSNMERLAILHHEYPSDYKPYFQITDTLKIKSTIQPVSERKYKINDYCNDVLSMFDAHMSSMVEQYKGKYVVLSSGGIDGNMVASWMYKNRLDFEVVGLTHGPLHGIKNNTRVERSMATWKKIVPTRIVKLDSNEIVESYINDVRSTTVPRPAINNMDGYDRLTLDRLHDHCDWIVHGGGSNSTMLHNGTGTFIALQSLDENWKSFARTETFREARYPGFCRTSYNEWLNGVSLDDYSKKGWLDLPVREHDVGCWISHASLYEDTDNKVLNLVNKEWHNLWEQIDWSGLSVAMAKDLLNASIWRQYIKDTAGQEVESETRTSNTCTEMITFNRQNTKLCESLLDDALHRFKGNIHIIGEILASKWLLKRFGQLPRSSIMLCHLEKFLQK